MAAIRQILVTRISPKGAAVEVRQFEDDSLQLAVTGRSVYAGLTIDFPRGITEGDRIVDDLLRITAAYVLRAETR